jgi:inorganic pyrophosphatase
MDQLLSGGVSWLGLSSVEEEEDDDDEDVFVIGTAIIEEDCFLMMGALGRSA